MPRLLLAAFLLAACGADGPPEPPPGPPPAAKPAGFRVSGDARVGVVVHQP